MQVGCQRAGWYSYDRLDNGGLPSATQILHRSKISRSAIACQPFRVIPMI
jgi:hypothetical protein